MCIRDRCELDAAKIRTDQFPFVARLEVDPEQDSGRLLVVEGRGEVDLVAGVLPRRVDELAALLVERKPRRLDGTVRRRPSVELLHVRLKFPHPTRDEI